MEGKLSIEIEAEKRSIYVDLGAVDRPPTPGRVSSRLMESFNVRIEADVQTVDP